MRLLARLDAEDPKRENLEQEHRAAVKRREELLASRPNVPARARVAETPLAGKLVRHRQQTKTVIDTLRGALANAEADLAPRLCPHMDRPHEAKKLLANVLAAPGRITLRKTCISVRLGPTADRTDRIAIAELLRTVNRPRLRLPGDPDRRPLRFGLLK